MRVQLFFVFLFAVLIAVLSNVSAEPEILMIDVNPENVDNQQDEEISFDGDCNICNEEELAYFYWNSSIAGVLNEGSSPTNINFVAVSSSFVTGDHNITLQVRDNNGTWSEITEEFTVLLYVAGRDDEEGITVNFAITPPSIHLGESARFEACQEMQPEPQPCVDDINPDLDFNWEIQWEGEANWSYLGNQEAFDYVDFQEGTHAVQLTITDNSNGESASDVSEISVLSPIPSAAISGPDQVIIKEGQSLDLSAICYDNTMEEIVCDYEWEIWEDESNGDLLYTFDTQDISVSDLTNEINKYDVMVRVIDDSGTYSMWVHVFVTVNPPNQVPFGGITILPNSLGGLTPEYYQFTELTFSSSSSNDPDGNIVAYNWWFNNELVSSTNNWVSSFNETGIYQVKLEVQDDNGVWSSKVSTNFKIIANTPPTIDFTISGEGFSFVFNSSATDLEGTVVQFEWLIGWSEGNQTIISYEQNSTWTTNQTGIYTVTFRAMDDGGLWSEASETFESKVMEQKNFVALFSSKNIEPGETFNIDFSETTGNVEKFVIVVNYPDSSQESHETSNSKYTLLFEEEGKYMLDVTVIWADGVPQDGLADWYGPTVYVGVDDSIDDSEPEDKIPEPDGEESGLPSISLVLALAVTLLVAVRRQR
ncbi:MAG: PKD domain-containing protein [Candidatus Poseidoniia archaeon]